jgi:purine-cytosine permease-like protein
MDTTKLKYLSARILFILGIIAMIIGAVDPLEGSVIILVGSGLVFLGTWVGHQARGLVVYRAWLFGMIVFGVIAMFALSSVGGIGGKTGHSMWWGLLLLPYPIGWILAMANLVARGIDRARHRHAR